MKRTTLLVLLVVILLLSAAAAAFAMPSLSTDGSCIKSGCHAEGDSRVPAPAKAAAPEPAPAKAADPAKEAAPAPAKAAVKSSAPSSVKQTIIFEFPGKPAVKMQAANKQSRLYITAAQFRELTGLSANVDPVPVRQTLEKNGYVVTYKNGTVYYYGGPAPAKTTSGAASGQKTVPSPHAAAIADIPSINDDAQNSPLGSRHWNFFKNNVSNAEDPEQNNCISCHSAVKIVDDPNAQLIDFLKAGQKYATGETEDPITGQVSFQYGNAAADGKYAGNNFEGITCRVCHEMNNEGLALRRPDNTCTLCHGRSFNWERGSGHHVTQDFFQGHGETYWDPSVHYTIGMQCQDCHTMNAVKHDYEPASAEEIVSNAECGTCHKNAAELENMIESTIANVSAAVEKINARVDTGKDNDSQGLIAKAAARANFIAGDLSNGAHNPQFAIKLINEANSYLDQYDKAAGKATDTPAFKLNLTVYSQAQSSTLGSAHWDMLENTISNEADPEQDRCISCHSAVAIVDDPNAKIADFLPAGAKYATGEAEDPATGEVAFQFAATTADGKYLKNRVEGITCRVCHTFEDSGQIALRRSPEQTCGLCHGRSWNWQTGSGHHVELAFFKGQGSEEKGIKEMPSPKAAMSFACQDCHFMDDTKHDFEPATPEQIAASSKCGNCHTAASVKTLITGIQEEVASTIAALEPRLEEAKAFVEQNPDNTAAKELYTQALAGISFIEDDFSEGVHNPPFARALMARSEKLLEEFEAKF